MELKQYESLTADLHKTANDVANAKRPDYTIGNADVLKNFKSVAERLGLTPMQVWAVYALKHVDAICAYAKGNTNPSEPIKMRFVDWLNYGDLGYALAEEGKPQDQRKTVIEMTPHAPFDAHRDLLVEFMGKHASEKKVPQPQLWESVWTAKHAAPDDAADAFAYALALHHAPAPLGACYEYPNTIERFAEMFGTFADASAPRKSTPLKNQTRRAA